MEDTQETTAAERLPPISSPGSTKGANLVPWEKEGLAQMRYQGAMTRLKNELLSTRNRAEHELKMRDTTISELRRYMGQQLELIESQKSQIRTLNKSLRDYQVCDSSQQRALAKTSGSADAQIRALRNKIRDMEMSHDHALSAAQEALDKAKKERNAMCLGLAALTQAALGGNEASSEDLAADLEAAMAEGGEPLPRTPAIWGQLRYEMDDRGNLASFSKAPGTFNRPFDKDGARAFAALSAQVARLHKQRALFRARSREAYERLAKLTGLLDNIDLDFTVVNALVDRMATEAEQVAAACGLLPLLKPDTATTAGSGKVSERLGVLWQLLTSLAGELLAAHAELQQYKLAQGEGVEGGRAWREPHVNAVARRARALDEYREQVQAAVGEVAYAPYQEVLSALRAAAERNSASASDPALGAGGAASPTGRRGGRSRAHSPVRTGGRSSVVPRAAHSPSGPAGASPLPPPPLQPAMAAPPPATAAKPIHAPPAQAAPQPVAHHKPEPVVAQPPPAVTPAIEQPHASIGSPSPPAAAAPPPATTSGALKEAAAPPPQLQPSSSGSASKEARKEAAPQPEPETQATPAPGGSTQPEEASDKHASAPSADAVAAAEAAVDHAGGLKAEPSLPKMAEPDQPGPHAQAPAASHPPAESHVSPGAQDRAAVESGEHSAAPTPTEAAGAPSEVAHTPDPSVAMSAGVSSLGHEEQAGPGETPAPPDCGSAAEVAGQDTAEPGPGGPQPGAEEKEEAPAQAPEEPEQRQEEQQPQQQADSKSNEGDEGSYAELEAAEAAMFGGDGFGTEVKANPTQAAAPEAEPEAATEGEGAGAGDEGEGGAPQTGADQQDTEQSKDMQAGAGIDKAQAKADAEGAGAAVQGEGDPQATKAGGAAGHEEEEEGDGGSSMAADEAEFEPLE